MLTIGTINSYDFFTIACWHRFVNKLPIEYAIWPMLMSIVAYWFANHDLYAMCISMYIISYWYPLLSINQDGLYMYRPVYIYIYISYIPSISYLYHCIDIHHIISYWPIIHIPRWTSPYILPNAPPVGIPLLFNTSWGTPELCLRSPVALAPRAWDPLVSSTKSWAGCFEMSHAASWWRISWQWTQVVRSESLM